MLAVKGFIITAAVHVLFLTIIKGETAPTVIIVGAGAAGIAAATKLLENNVTNVTILEAEGRIGGRIHSVEFGESVLDLGAQWCHGEENNIVYELVKDLNVLEPGEFFLNYYHSSERVLDRVFIDELHELFFNIYTEEKENETSVAAYMISRYNNGVRNLVKDDLQKLKLAEEFLDFLMKTVLIETGAFSWYDVSAKRDYKECKGVHYLNWKDHGFKTILDVLMQKYPHPEEQLPIDDKVLLNKEVGKIVWDDADNFQRAIVECLDGSIYSADHVIFTASLGVLKDRHNITFQPSLPAEKVNVIQDLGINAAAKVFLHFPERWWPEDNFTDFSFIWGEEDKTFLLQSDQAWLTNLVRLYTVNKSPKVLSAWFAGEFIPDIEKCSDEVIINGIMSALIKFLGHQFDNILMPYSVLRYAWFSDRNHRGTYSFQTVESRKRKVSPEIILSQPLTSNNGKQSLLFAGEATHPIYYSTVHGAIETGHREALRIINLYK